MKDCNECDAECCRYITLDYATPKDSEDWDEVKWMLLHKGVMVYLDNDGDWQVEIRTPCKYIDEKTFKCNNYRDRPEVCKDHGTHECELNEGDFAQVIFKKSEDVDEYLKKKKKKKKK